VGPACLVAAALRRLPEGTFGVLRDRARAIEVAITEAGPGDVVLVAGKGHEDYQLIGAERRPFSDRKYLQQHAGGAA